MAHCGHEAEGFFVVVKKCGMRLRECGKIVGHEAEAVCTIVGMRAEGRALWPQLWT